MKSITLTKRKGFQKLSSSKQIRQRLQIKTDPSIPQPKSLRDTDTSSLCQSPKNVNRLTIYDFIRLRKLGTGKFGKVYLVIHRLTGFLLAMKIIPKAELISEDSTQTQKMRNQFIRQIKIQMFLNHHNLIKLYAFFADETNFYLLMELGCDGQLYQTMQKKAKFSQEATSILMREVVSGISFMHSKFIIHRDIKPQNIVLIHGTAKICDFGWSVYCPKEVRSTLCGTPLYLSPQILKGNKYNQKIDTWALGTLSYELFTGENPFNIKKKEEISKIITEDFVMVQGSQVFRNFVTFILRKDPEKRPNAESIYSHPFITKFKQLQTNEQICEKVTAAKLKKMKSLK